MLSVVASLLFICCCLCIVSLVAFVLRVLLVGFVVSLLSVVSAICVVVVDVICLWFLLSLSYAPTTSTPQLFGLNSCNEKV